jgi:membrane-bound ClpP family serine protease
MVDPWVWAIVLLFVAILLVVIELFVPIPTAGLAAFLAVCAIVAACWLGFSQGSAVGLAVTAGAVLGIPAVVIVGFKYWPSTSLGKRMLLHVPTSDEVLPENDARRTLVGLVGRVGRAKSQMLPSGIIAVDGTTLDAVSDGMPVEIGQRVRVIEVRGNRVVVRGLADETAEGAGADPLEQPIDWESPEPFPPPQA